MDRELQSASFNPNRPWFTSRSAGFLAVVLVVGLLNFVGHVCIELIPTRTWLAIPFLIGCASAEVSLIAVVCGLIRGNGIKRITIALVVALFWLATYLLGLKILDNRIPMDVIFIIAVVSFVSIALYQLPITAYYLVSRRVMTFQGGNDDKPVAQFQIRHLLIATTLFAIMISATKLIVDNGKFAGGSIPWWEVFFFFTTFVTIVAAVLIPAILIMFDAKRRFVAACVATITVVVVGPVLAFIGLSISFPGRGPFSDPSEFLKEIYPGTALFIFGNLLTLILFFWLLKGCGLHLTSASRSIQGSQNIVDCQ